MTHRARRAVLIVTTLLSVAPCVASAETTQPVSTAIGEDEALYRCKSRSAEVAINFKPDMELKELMTWVVGFTCKNFILDPRVVTTGKKVTVIAPNKMTANEAYRLFLVALSTMNLTVVPKGNVLRITDAGAARRDTLPIYKKGTPGDGDQVVRYILRPTYAQSDVLVQALSTLKSEIGDVQQIGTMLMMTDYAGNVRDMLSLVKMVDVPKGSEGIYTIAIEHATASVVAEKVGGILGTANSMATTAGKPGAAPGPAAAPSALVPSKVMVDERTNTIILAASETGYERFRALAKRIDVPLDIEGGQSVHVYRLANAIAEELAKTINDTVGQSGQPANPAAPTAPKPTPLDPGGPAAGTTIDGKVRVIADKPTNSLIVLSTGRDFLALKEVISSLDQPRPQVYIEAMIVEVGVGDELSTDGSLHGASPLDKAMLLGGVHTSDSFSSTSTKSFAAKGIVAGLLGPSKTFLGLTIPSYGVLFNALADKSKANVLSTPSVMALDNEVAKFKVGKTIPYLARTTFGGTAGSADSPFGSASQSIDRVDLNLELEVRPHISSENSVLLELKHDAKEQGDDTSLGPTWNNRAVETRVLVRDQQTIVIGGLMQEKLITTSSQTPILGDIPLIGYFFKSTHKIKRKSNMLILLTPYIVKNQMELQMIKERKVREHEEFVGSLHAFDAMKYTPKLDYARKCGLVEEINRSLKAVEEDAAMMESMKSAPRVPSGPLELPEPGVE